MNIINSLILREKLTHKAGDKVYVDYNQAP
ncbi:MAG: hypothetical protein IEMM0006_0852 [bacterium]|nr:MAG: hypothetical protein IEMM0006_0852 [bacterium]